MHKCRSLYKRNYDRIKLEKGKAKKILKLIKAHLFNLSIRKLIAIRIVLKLINKNKEFKKTLRVLMKINIRFD